MLQTEMDTFKDILQQMLVRLEQLPRTLEGIAIENRPDIIDAVQYASQRELEIQRLERDCILAGKIRAALDRLQEGTYGYCLRCDSEISSKRLTAVPWAVYCITCQEDIDRELESSADGEATLH